MVVARRSDHVRFFALVGLALLTQFAFFANMVVWRSSPDKGWSVLGTLGPKIVGVTYPLAEEAGLRVGDTILTVNGKSYETTARLIALLDWAVGHTNVYLVKRIGNTFTVSITNQELGVRRVFLQSGVFWLLGMIFIGIGILVFLMKPYHEQSWAFLLMAMTMGIYSTYAAPSFFFKPSWLGYVRVLIPPFLPATILHLAVLFPQRRAYFADNRWWLATPYLFALVLLVFSQSLALRPWLSNMHLFYLFASVLVFIGSTISSYVRPTSVAVRLQSLVIFAGVTLALFVPVVELLSNRLFQASLFPNPIVMYLVFLIFFPLSIGYAIARHDLFEIDVIVRRTYGYMLSTAAVLGFYGLTVSTLNLTFRSSEIARSPLFSVTFALIVIFLFEPLHKRFQRFVDRVFYRQQYDYRRTIRNISEAMTSILDEEQICRTLVGSVVKEMFLDNGALLVPNSPGTGYHARVVEGGDGGRLGSATVDADDVVMRFIKEDHEAIFRHDLELHPRYEGQREALRRTFEALSSEVILPMKYKDELRGIISLGRKKSGKMFTPEDLDLLKTMTSQSAIALENAKLFKENLEKGRMEEELKIAHDMQISMLPEKPPAIEGFQLAARSIAAREVGGDFYDFIVMGGAGTEKRLGVVIADVSGKGVSGALVMAASRSTYRVLADAHSSVEEVMTIANQRLQRDIKKGMFVALIYAVLDPSTRSLTFSNAGQTQPILCPATEGTPSFLDTDGDRFPLGIVADSSYQEAQVCLQEGDTVIFYTDGVVEAMNGAEELYGFERLMTSIEEGRGLDANRLLEHLIEDVSRFVGNVEQHDDLTIVVAKVAGQQERAEVRLSNHV